MTLVVTMLISALTEQMFHLAAEPFAKACSSCCLMSAWQLRWLGEALLGACWATVLLYMRGLQKHSWPSCGVAGPHT